MLHVVNALCFLFLAKVFYDGAKTSNTDLAAFFACVILGVWNLVTL